MNTFGRNLRLTTFGESHGLAIGGVLDGFPSGFKIDISKIYEEIEKRRPGKTPLVSARNEDDKPEFLSGLTQDNVTLGTPIGFIIRNKNFRPSDYSELTTIFRPSHADYTYRKKYNIRAAYGGGRSSARETLNWVIAGAIVNQFLESKGIKVTSEITGAGRFSIKNPIKGLHSDGNNGYNSHISVSKEERNEIENEILIALKDGDSVGGRVTCLITGLLPGVGNPVAEKLHSRLAEAMMSINAVKGFEYGIGFKASEKKGSEISDYFIEGDFDKGLITETNYSGGIQGGISNGMPVYFNVFFKPTPSFFKPLRTVDENGQKKIIRIKGRHDPCVALRAVPVVKAMTALVLGDFLI